MLRSVGNYVAFGRQLCCVRSATMLRSVGNYVVFGRQLCCIRSATMLYSVGNYVAFGRQLCCIRSATMLYSVGNYVAFKICFCEYHTPPASAHISTAAHIRQHEPGAAPTTYHLYRELSYTSWRSHFESP